MFAFASPRHLNQILRRCSPEETRLHALNDAIVLLAGRCDVGHKNAIARTRTEVHARWSLPRRPKALRVRLHWSHNRHDSTVWTDSRQRSRNQPRYCSVSAATWKLTRLACCLPTSTDWPNKCACFEPRVWHADFQQVLTGPTHVLVSCRESGMLSSNKYWLAQQICLFRAESLACCLPTSTAWPNKCACFEPRVWPHTCCNLHRIRILMQWTNRI
jgi:hypothetical protein